MLPHNVFISPVTSFMTDEEDQQYHDPWVAREGTVQQQSTSQETAGISYAPT